MTISNEEIIHLQQNVIKDLKGKLYMELKVGDVVMLKSGGPKMTVKEVVPELHNVDCYWFDEQTLKFGTFPNKSLETVK